VFSTTLPGGPAVAAVALSPCPPHTALVSLDAGPPFLIDTTTGTTRQLPALELKAAAAGGRPPEVAALPPAAAAAAASPGALSRDGSLAFVAQGRGLFAVFDCASGRVVDLVKLPAAVRVLSVALNRRGTMLLANCHDKTIRLLLVKPAPPGAKTYGVDELPAALAGAEVRGAGAGRGLAAGGVARRSPSLCWRRGVAHVPWESQALTHAAPSSALPPPRPRASPSPAPCCCRPATRRCSCRPLRPPARRSARRSFQTRSSARGGAASRSARTASTWLPGSAPRRASTRCTCGTAPMASSSACWTVRGRGV
jgi:hypothetical protein